MTREVIINEIAKGYFHFLKQLQFENKFYMEAMREARGKFVANFYIYLCTKERVNTLMMNVKDRLEQVSLKLI